MGGRNTHKDIKKRTQVWHVRDDVREGIHTDGRGRHRQGVLDT